MVAVVVGVVTFLFGQVGVLMVLVNTMNARRDAVLGVGDYSSVTKDIRTHIMRNDWLTMALGSLVGLLVAASFYAVLPAFVAAMGSSELKPLTSPVFVGRSTIFYLGMALSLGCLTAFGLHLAGCISDWRFMNAVLERPS